jgi:hypothetical protein
MEAFLEEPLLESGEGSDGERFPESSAVGEIIIS